MSSQAQPIAGAQPTRLRVRFAETDQMGIAHHSAYVVWFEAGRVEWMRGRGMSYRAMEAAGVSLAVAELQLSYRAAARFDDLLSLDTALTTVRSRKVAFRYRLWREDDGVLLATGATVHVPTDRNGAAVRLAPEYLEPLRRALGEVG
jgi:acyl-CoA thioester hydrolase